MSASRKQPAGQSRRVRWGQNFLVDHSVAERIVDWARIDGEAVLEIGPGRGAITGLLASRCARLWLVEIDPHLASHWVEAFTDDPRVTVITGDVLELDLARIVDPPVRVVANLPYDVGTAVVTRLLAVEGLTSSWVVMLQKEVCNRLLAAPGSKAYGLLSIHTQLRADVESGFDVEPECFRPAPKVVSKVIAIRPLGHLRYPVGDLRLFEDLVRVAFGARRKMLRNTLGGWLDRRIGAARAALIWDVADIDPGQRPETISVAGFAKLSTAVHSVLQEDA